MSKGTVFWVLMIIWLVLGIFNERVSGDARIRIGGTVLEFVLLFLLGWGVFGFVIQ